MRGRFQHLCNPLHVFCRLRGLRLSQNHALFLARIWERIYRTDKKLAVALALVFVLLAAAWTTVHGVELTYRIAPREYQDWTWRAGMYGPMLTQHMGEAFEDQQPFLRDVHWGIGGEIERKAGESLGVGFLAWKGLDSRAWTSEYMFLAGAYASWWVTDWLFVRGGAGWIDHYQYRGFVPMLMPGIEVPLVEPVHIGCAVQYVPEWAMPMDDASLLAVFNWLSVRW